MKIVGVAVSVSLLLASMAPAAPDAPVRIESGLLSGVAGQTPGMRVFKGVPYAAPPVGELRWREPKPVPSWRGIRKGDHAGHDCYQDVVRRSQFRLEHDTGLTDISEDCLYLNIWTSATDSSARLPVMVYIHGGSLQFGAASEALLDGEQLARKGVVTVNLNYRMGAFGFLAHPALTTESARHVSGNYGFLDQIAALRWLQRNIRAFGGDPSNVTVFGQSAGSRSVFALLASPLTSGLFRRAIAQSHGYLGGSTPTLARSEEAGVKLASALGASSLSDLRAVPAARLLEVQNQTGYSGNVNVDGWFMPADIYDVFARGKQQRVPVMAGSTSDESTSRARPTTAAAFAEEAHRRYGGRADEFLKAYPASTDAEANEAQVLSATDRAGSYDARALVQFQTKTAGVSAWLFRFSHKPPIAAPDTEIYDGVFHGADLYYVFQNFAFKKYWKWTDTDRRLGDAVSSYWAQFAKTGDPNGSGLPRWTAYDDGKQELMNFADQAAMTPVPRRAALDFLQSYLHGDGSSARR
jgi:para-nitrobenzyl esterase